MGIMTEVHVVTLYTLAMLYNLGNKVLMPRYVYHPMNGGRKARIKLITLSRAVASACSIYLWLGNRSLFPYSNSPQCLYCPKCTKN